MEAIFHEKQQGSLCAQHCLNSLLQNDIYTPVDLADIAKQLDEQERLHMGKSGWDQPDESDNYDDSGYFSIQVLQKALNVWNLELIPFKSSQKIAIDAREDPSDQQAYICNLKSHWLTVRKFGRQWFNLNSMLEGPELISEGYLSLFLASLQQQQYDVFVVVGSLPDCDADRVLSLTPAVQALPPKLIYHAHQKVPAPASGPTKTFSSQDLQNAFSEMGKCSNADISKVKSLLTGNQNENVPGNSSEQSYHPKHNAQQCEAVADDIDEDEMLARAIQLSMENDEDED